MESGTPTSVKGNAVLHIRTDSDTDLEQLFNAAMHPKDGGPSSRNRSLPMRMRKLPPSFFQPPPSSNGTFSGPNPNGTQIKDGEELGYVISHSKAHSSPASLGFMVQQQQQQQSPRAQRVAPAHQRTQSYDALESDTLPPGWEGRATPSGQKYYVNHFERVTTWIDPRLKSQSLATLNANQALGTLPEGWEQGVTPKGEVYYINHESHTTSWFDPRLNRNTSGTGSYQQGQKTPHSQQMNLRYLQLEKEKLRQRQQMIFHQELMLQQQIGSPGGDSAISSNSIINNLVREKYGNSPGSFSPVGAMTPNHQRVGSADSGLDGMGSFLSPTSSDVDVALNSMDQDVDMEQGSTAMRQSKESTTHPSHEANLNQLNQVSQGRLPEFFDRMPATNVDLGILESESDLGTGLEGLHSEVLSDVDIMLSPNPSKSDGFLTWL